MPQLLFPFSGLFTGLLVPFCLGLRLSTCQADTTGQDQHMGRDRISPALNGYLGLVKEFGQPFVVACLKKPTSRAPLMVLPH